MMDESPQTGHRTPRPGGRPRRHTPVPDAGRVIAGTARSIRIQGAGPETRPLADRVKQTAFAILEPDLRGSRFLDLFAGSGAAGIEALSRGAAQATFVERDAAAARVIAANLERTGLRAGSPGRATIVRADVLSWLRKRARAGEEPFDVVFIDPPYADEGLLASAIESVEPHLAPGARLVAKHFWRSPPPARVGLLASDRERRFGETTLTFYRRMEDA
jgi:16S rRNA (guanine966-N2)-methyltransferase